MSIVDNLDNSEVRASVLEAALDLGVESSTFTEWLEGESLPSISGLPLSENVVHIPDPFPLNHSVPGGSHHPTQVHLVSHL